MFEPASLAAIFFGMAVGASIGLVTGFLTSSGLDALPEDAVFDRDDHVAVRFGEPALIPSLGPRGEFVPAYGINLISGRW